MIEVRYHDRVNVLQELFANGTLLRASSPFDRAEWFALLEQTGLSPLIAIAQDDESEAVLALTEADGVIKPLRNWYSFTWRPLTSANPGNPNPLTEIASQLKSRSYRVTLEPVPDEDGSASMLVTAFRQAGWRVEATQCDTNHVLNVGGASYADYLAKRPGPVRTTLKRKAKKVETQILCHFDEALWDDYETIYSASWKPKEDYPAMLRQFAQAEGKAGRLRLGMAWHESKPVAAQCWTVENGTAYIHKLAYLESAKRLSAGTTLSAALFKHVIDIDRVELVDFGTGDQGYKADWMNAVRPRYRIDCLDMSQPRGWLALARKTVTGLREPEVQELAPLPQQR